MMVKQMRILVTGGLGFIGSHFVKDMLENYNDAEIFNVDNMGYGSNPANLSAYSENKRYHFIKADINDVSGLGLDVDVIVNIAAETHVDRSISDPGSFVRSNYYGTHALLEYARNKNIQKFVQVSTDEVYGAAQTGYSFKENDAINPSNPYSATKAGADLLLQSYFMTYGMNISITRCTNNFGPYQFPEKLIPKTIVSIMRGLPIYLYGDGSQIRDWLYVSDHVEAIRIVMKKGKAGETYNISASNEVSNAELANKIQYIVKEKSRKVSQIVFTEDRPGHDKRYSLNSRKIKEDLGWRPKVAFEDALLQTVVWYLNNEKWWEPLITPSVLHPEPWKLQWKEKREN
jgi:dTDP-glucose 4,6-dehydratase